MISHKFTDRHSSWNSFLHVPSDTWKWKTLLQQPASNEWETQLWHTGTMPKSIHISLVKTICQARLEAGNKQLKNSFKSLWMEGWTNTEAQFWFDGCKLNPMAFLNRWTTTKKTTKCHQHLVMSCNDVMSVHVCSTKRRWIGFSPSNAPEIQRPLAMLLGDLCAAASAPGWPFFCTPGASL